MNFFSKLVLSAVLATTTISAYANEVVVTQTIPSAPGVQTRYVKYAHFCARNTTKSQVVLITSWSGEVPTVVKIGPNAQMLYRLETTSMIPSGLDDSAQMLEVGYRAVGVAGGLKQQTEVLGYSAHKLTRCSSNGVRNYDFTYALTGTGKSLILVPTPADF